MTSTLPEEWHHLLTAPLTGDESVALEETGIRVERAYNQHRASWRHQSPADWAPCDLCRTLGEAMIALLGVAYAAAYLPIGASVLYHGSVSDAHGVYSVAHLGFDGWEPYYRLADGAGAIVLYGVALGSVTGC